MASKQVEFGDKNGGSWGTIKTGRKGWTVETYSRTLVTRTGSVVFVPFDAPGVGVDRDDDLDAEYNEGMTNGCAIRNFAASFTERCKVRRKGDIVQ
jgi:hypothetical protein